MRRAISWHSDHKSPPNTASRKCTGIMHPNPGNEHRGWRGGSLRVFRHFARLEVDSDKIALSRLTHPPSSGCYATGNANRWAVHAINKLQSISLSKERCIYDPSQRYCKEFF